MSLFFFRLLVCLAVAVTAATAYAQRDRDTYNPNNQTFEVSGQVNVAGTNDAAREIPVRLERFSGGLVDQINIDTRGRFRFTNLHPGYYKIVMNVPGYGTAHEREHLH